MSPPYSFLYAAIACIEDAVVIERILSHFDAKAIAPKATMRPAVPGTATSQLVQLINPLGIEPPGCVINRRVRVSFRPRA